MPVRHQYICLIAAQLFTFWMSLWVRALAGMSGRPQTGKTVVSSHYWASRTGGWQTSAYCAEVGFRPGRPTAFKSLITQHRVTGKRVQNFIGEMLWMDSIIFHGLSTGCFQEVVVTLETAGSRNLSNRHFGIESVISWTWIVLRAKTAHMGMQMEAWMF